MRLIIDATGGIAGDMFSAALVSAGADFQAMQAAMLAAAGKLGTAQINPAKTSDGSYRLDIRLKPSRAHLGGHEAKKILSELFDTFTITPVYRNFGLKALEILLQAEIQAHREFNIVVSDEPGDADHHGKPHHEHIHMHVHDTVQRHASHPSHPPHHGENENGFLHEAQDIVIDIMGAVMGLQFLGVDLEKKAQLIAPVSVGGGTVRCSHGKLSVPAPATRVILDTYHLDWAKGPLPVELATPTGVTLPAALGASKHDPAALAGAKIIATGLARGTKELAIPPLKLYLVES